MKLVYNKTYNCFSKKLLQFATAYRFWEAIVFSLHHLIHFIIISKVRIRLQIRIEIRLKFNQSEEKKSISSLVNFTLIGQILTQFQF